MNFFRISRQIPENNDAFCFFNQICENKLESCRKFWNLWELFTIIQNYSLVSLGGRAARADGAAPRRVARRRRVRLDGAEHRAAGRRGRPRAADAGAHGHD